MTLVERGTHPKWSGGFVTDPKCACGHGEHLHGSWDGVAGCYYRPTKLAIVPVLFKPSWCRCKGFEEKR
mgnify:CR=1 FL=1